MSNMRTVNRSFGGGEITPEMYGRIEDAKYQAGAALLSNFIATPQGPAQNRAGFQYVNAVKDSTKQTRLIPFIFSPEQTMVVELGAGYFRFHTQGQTLIYSTVGMEVWDAPSGAISISRSAPATVTWTAHGLVTGNPILFYLYGGSTSVPTGLKVGYRYTVVVVDADNFTLLDNGVQVDLTAPTGAIAASYVGAGTTSATCSAYPHYTATSTSSVLTGLGSHVVTGGVATLNLNVTSLTYFGGADGAASVKYQYNTGAGWITLYTVTNTEDVSVVEDKSFQIPLADTSTLQLRVLVTSHSVTFDSVSATGAINTWSVDTPAVAIPPSTTDVRAYRDYLTGDFVSYGGSSYIALVDHNGGNVVPGTDATVWSLLPASLIYEVPNAYAEADLFAIHYAQSADVMTLVHPNYPPAELKRLSATVWTFSNIAFAPQLASPSGVTVTPSPGFKVVISSGTGTYTTAASHTLAYGDPVYISGGSSTAGFYLVSDVPLDGSGNPEKNQLQLMDYNGTAVTGSLTGATIQFGSKIIDITNFYEVTAVAADGINESAVSTAASALCNLNVTGSYNTIAWSAVTGAARYRIYKKKNGLYGFIGETTALTFSDNNIAADFDITPPIFDTVFNSAGEYPGAVSYFEQRRTFAGTTNHPQDVWLTKTGTESDVSYSIPVKDTDRIQFRVASREANKILHIVPLNALILLTSSAEFRGSPSGGDTLVPTNVSSKAQSYIGAGTVQPSVINNSLVFTAARGGHVREMGYSWQSNGFVTGDLSLRAKHLFDNLTIADQAYAKCPIPIVWFVSSNGKLLGMTYIPEEQIGAWHQHATSGNSAGFFESIAAVPEGNEDRLYAVIRRTINGQTVRFIERMASRLVGNIEDCFFVDAGATYDGAPTAVITGLTWLEGETVAILADGAVHAKRVVSGGQITLDRTASVVQVGLPIVADLETLPLAMQIDGFGQGRKKNINKVWLKVTKSSGMSAGPDTGHIVPLKQRTTEVYGTPPDLLDGEFEIVISPSWQDSGQVFIRQSVPLPLTVVGLTLEVAIGG